MTPDRILQLIAAEDFENANAEIARYCATVDTTQPSQLQAASELVGEALIAARSLRAHLGGQATELAAAKQFLDSQPQPAVMLDLMG